ncbi:MAG: Na-translocating system protein MpsC family protein [Solirubrobacteraceae bacterium]|nr:Na-translocating system protein MpsC family protein [Solirubrobacteraceae bacterium]
MDATPTVRLSNSEQGVAIANLVVATAVDQTGRGPSKVRAWVSDEVVTVVLRDNLTKAEHTLIADGRGDMVSAMRRAFQHAMAPILIPQIEEITGRHVEAFLSDHHVDPDIAVETFIMNKAGSPSATDRMPA